MQTLKDMDPASRFQLQNSGVFVKAYDKLVGAKIAVSHYARRYRIFGYRAVDSETGETWKWDHEIGRLARIDVEIAEK